MLRWGIEHLWEIVATLLLPLLIAIIIYLIGGKVAPKVPKSGDKLEPYACGERWLPVRLRINLEDFFLYALYFMVFDILALLLATSMGASSWLPLLYLLIMFASLLYIMRGD
ncbi:MAG: NADH-quinone oxidoreductase subunit A [Candidatus Bathyarchaeia archaeon]